MALGLMKSRIFLAGIDREHLDLQGNLTDGAKDALEITARHILRYTPNPELDEFVWRGLVVGNVRVAKQPHLRSHR